ncbi:MAG TPA: 30S ribosomal protein S18 [Vulgatibacter sp.]|nr:30S ribosomal protein S18 [Vulgatibacter sp.]
MGIREGATGARPGGEERASRPAGEERSGRGGGGGFGGRRGFGRRKVCRFCADKTAVIDYKDAATLKLFLTERGKIIPRRISGNCATHQRQVASAIKRGRQVALLPYTIIQG